MWSRETNHILRTRVLQYLIKYNTIRDIQQSYNLNKTDRYASSGTSATTLLFEKYKTLNSELFPSSPVAERLRLVLFRRTVEGE